MKAEGWGNSSVVVRRTVDRMVTGSPAGEAGEGGELFSRVNFLPLQPCFIAVAVKDPGHCAKGADGRL